MAIKVLEIHHTGYRLDTGAEKLEDTASFYSDVLGLQRDRGRPTIPGIPGLLTISTLLTVADSDFVTIFISIIFCPISKLQPIKKCRPVDVCVFNK
jgi:hypothetical protein